MRWLWVLGVLAVLFALFCLTRLGVLVTVEETAAADVTFGFLRFRIVPSQKTKKAKPEKPEKETPKEDKGGGAPKKFPRPTAADLRTAYRMLWPPCRKALERMRRGLRIDPLELAVTIPGRNDPARAAELYGEVHAAVWTGMPVMEQLICIPRPSIHIGLDFDADRPAFRGRFGLSMRIGTLLAMGFGMLGPALKWFLQYRKTHRPPEQQAAAQTAEQKG